MRSPVQHPRERSSHDFCQCSVCLPIIGRQEPSAMLCIILLVGRVTPRSATVPATVASSTGRRVGCPVVSIVTSTVIASSSHVPTSTTTRASTAATPSSRHAWYVRAFGDDLELRISIAGWLGFHGRMKSPPWGSCRETCSRWGPRLGQQGLVPWILRTRTCAVPSAARVVHGDVTTGEIGIAELYGQGVGSGGLPFGMSCEFVQKDGDPINGPATLEMGLNFFRRCAVVHVANKDTSCINVLPVLAQVVILLVQGCLHLSQFGSFSFHLRDPPLHCWYLFLPPESSAPTFFFEMPMRRRIARVVARIRVAVVRTHRKTKLLLHRHRLHHVFGCSHPRACRCPTWCGLLANGYCASILCGREQKKSKIYDFMSV